MSATHDIDGLPATPSEAPQDTAVVVEEPVLVATDVSDEAAQVRAGAIRSARLLGQSVGFQNPIPAPPEYMANDAELVTAYEEGWQSVQEA